MAGVARQAQTSQESYHDKAREHPDDGKHPDGGLYNKGPSYSSYSGYIMMPNMNNDPYMSNGSLSPPIPRTACPDILPLLRSPPSTRCLRVVLDRLPHLWAGKVSLYIPSREDSGNPTHPHCQSTLPCPGFPIT
ncbi:lymphoid enhancer binding factor 1 [Phyllostomus discolor]|uniref:Lymphoid enhancer binding factor 1 n=1 Tax=Phyllostomus discolor TaxID=89673 RepID=A0A834BDI4_9CHIR|nr:lymphoid enhancer binding factor 1 [Phyllostomus discolor]